MAREMLIGRIPKVELHVHLEGTLEPDLAFSLADRNGIRLRYRTANEMRRGYRFSDLGSFLDIYYASCSVLQTEKDFFDVTWAYLLRADADNVRHVEPFFDPQTHVSRGIPYVAVLDGITRALQRGHSELGITSCLIACLLRDLTEHDANATLDDVLHHGGVDGIGLDSGEVGNPPEKFAAVFRRATASGLHAVAHAGEEGPPSYVSGALDSLGAERIDHGVRCLEDPALVARLVRDEICLTVCPLSNVALRIVDRIEHHPLGRMLEAGLRVTVNSDDPAYFGGYIGENYLAVASGLDLSEGQLIQLAQNAIEGSFAKPARKRELCAELERVAG